MVAGSFRRPLQGAGRQALMFSVSPTPGGSCVEAKPSDGSSFGSERLGATGAFGGATGAPCPTDPYPEILMHR